MLHIALCCLEGSTSKDGFIFYHGLNGLNEVVLWRIEEIKKFVAFPGLTPCSPMSMLSQISELPCLTIPIRLVCPQADRKASKQNSCPWQYKMSLRRRLLTITSDLPGACPMAYCPPGSICGMLSIPRALPPVTHGSALQAPERLRDTSFY